MPALVGAVAVSLLLVGALYIVGTRRQRRVLRWCAVLIIGVAILLLARSTETPDPASPINAVQRTVIDNAPVRLPEANREAGYVSSEACRECHQDQFASWHNTYHRTMTQPATTQSVVPSFEDVTLTSRGRTYHLTRRDDEFWVDTIDPAAELRAFVEHGGRTDPSRLPRVQKRIVMTTGSHHHQTYWMQNANGLLLQFPWVYHIDTDRWVYRIDSFLRPPGDNVTFNIWNMTCIACHSTGGNPGMNPVNKSMHSAGELGISCEACHGPGQQHVAVARSQSPSTQQISHTITHPANVDAVASAQICGQCHAISGRTDEQEFLLHGDPYRAGGQDFEALRQVVRQMDDGRFQQEHFAESIKSGFWPDGTVRTGGREYNGLIRSKCYSEGTAERQMSCLSCHSMHSYASNDKLMAASKPGNAQCIQCHDDSRFTTQLQQHTHHAADSSGSRCVNCHMPHTSYALFSAIRSHRIQSPSVQETRNGGRPNACNLCHLDRTQHWAATKLREWYEIESDELPVRETEISAGAVWALQGDAAQRAVVAWHFGWAPANDASGGTWSVPLLAELLSDPYSAVRYIAAVSLRSRAEFADLKYDFDGPGAHQTEVRQSVLEAWNRSRGTQQRDVSEASRKLLKPDGSRDDETVKRLLSEQDQRPISIVE